jgi:hypothetical protein
MPFRPRQGDGRATLVRISTPRKIPRIERFARRKSLCDDTLRPPSQMSAISDGDSGPADSVGGGGNFIRKLRNCCERSEWGVLRESGGPDNLSSVTSLL